MPFYKKLLLGFAGLGFAIGTFGLALTYSLNNVFGSPDQIKRSVQDSKAYEAIADSMIREMVTNTSESIDAPTNSKAIENAANAAITPEMVQSQGEKIIDNTYDWLDGTTESPDLALDTAEIQQQMKTNLNTAAIDRLQGLADCTPTQLQQLDPSTLDPFTLPCRPPGLNAETIRQRFEQGLGSNQGLIQEDSFGSDGFTTGAGQMAFTESERIPQAFQLGQKLPWIFGLLTLLSAAAAIFLQGSKRKAVTKLSKKLLVVGVLLFVFIFLTTLLLSNAKPNIGGADSVATSAVILSLIDSLVSAMSNPVKVFATTYVVIGVVGIIGAKFVRTQARPRPGTPSQSVPLAGPSPQNLATPTIEASVQSPTSPNPPDPNKPQA